MQMANIYPPGRVLWAMRDHDLHPVHRCSLDNSEKDDHKLRLFEVLDVEKVFSQVIFARDMLRYVCDLDLTIQLNIPVSAHMPHQYDQVLHDLL